MVLVWNLRNEKMNKCKLRKDFDMSIEAISAVSSLQGASSVNDLEQADQVSQLDMEKVTRIIESLDSDGDHALTMDESKFPKEVFEMLDTDGDQMVSAQEYLDGAKNIPNNLKALKSAIKTINNTAGLKNIEGMKGLSSANLRQDILDRSGHIKPKGSSKS